MTYLLITPARDEETFIELTIKSVVQQTVRPVRWLVVSDGSTDRTDEIVGRYALQHDWIELFRMPPRQNRDFGGKARCFNAGYAHLCPGFRPAGSTGCPSGRTSPVPAGDPPGVFDSQLSALNPPRSALPAPHSAFDLVASLDADITFDPGYFEFLLGKFAQDPKLGLAGTPFSEHGATYDYRFSSTEHVSGACQLFRRECFEDIGGYVPVQGGGIDVIAVLSARMKGWHTRTFTEKSCYHHRPMGSANHRNKLRADFKLGQRGYCLGFHPLWQVFRSIYQMTRKPYITGGCALFLGYFWAMLRRVERPIGPELVAFQRRDQMRRLRAFFLRKPATPKLAVPLSSTL